MTPPRTLRGKVAVLATGALVLFPLSACGDADGGSGGRVQVVTTVAPITSIAAAVAGDRADVEGLVPEGTNSHTFEPPPSAAKQLAGADVIFINGLKLEDPTAELAEQNKKKDTPLVEIGTQVLPESEWIYDFSFPKADGKPNPHLWTDPTYAIAYAGVIRDELSRIDPEGRETYAANHDSFVAQATELSEALKKDQQSVPASKRVLLTYHDAYAYFAKTYGWKVIGAIQPKNFEDPTPKEVAALIDQVKKEKVPVVFGSEVFPSTVLREIGEATGAHYEDTLRDDDLPGKPGEPVHSWMGLMRYDYQTMITGLGGQAPTLGALDVSPAVPDRAHYPQ